MFWEAKFLALMTGTGLVIFPYMYFSPLLWLTTCNTIARTRSFYNVYFLSFHSFHTLWRLSGSGHREPPRSFSCLCGVPAVRAPHKLLNPFHSGGRFSLVPKFFFQPLSKFFLFETKLPRTASCYDICTFLRDYCCLTPGQELLGGREACFNFDGGFGPVELYHSLSGTFP